MDHNTIQSPQRSMMRNQLWPEAMCNSALFFASLLTAAVYPSCNADSETVAWLRLKTIQSINGVMQQSQSKPNDAIIGAVSLLAGWELEYGDDLNYDAHVQGLKIMVHMRGGLHNGGISSIMVQIILAVTDDLALYAGKKPAFLPSITYPFQLEHPSTGLPEGFAALRNSRLLLPAELDLVHQLHLASLSRPVSDSSLCTIQQRISEYDPRKHLAVDFCPLQSSDDDEVNYQAEWHIRLATLCVARRLRCSGSGMPNRAPLDDQYSTYHLQPERMVGTIYAEVCLWALFMICTTVAPANHYLKKVMKGLLESLGLCTWPDTAKVLGRYLYPQEYDQACCDLWTVAMTLSPSGQCELPSQQPSRYNAAVFKWQ